MPARILVIEDNPTNLELLSYLLASFGHKVIAAGDGQSGLEMARQEKPELVICDVQMPGMDGYQVAKEFKQDAALRKIPLIAVTAYAMVGDRERLVAVGFDGYMSKPIDPGKFVVEIQKFLSPEQQSVQPVIPETLTQTVPRLNNAEATATLLVIDDSEVNLNEPFSSPRVIEYSPRQIPTKRLPLRNSTAQTSSSPMFIWPTTAAMKCPHSSAKTLS